MSNKEHSNSNKTLIATIIRDLKNNTNLSNGLLSLVLHGGISLLKDEDRYLDLDIIFVYENASIQLALKKINEEFTSICNKQIQEGDIAFYALKSGPMHPLKDSLGKKLFSPKKNRVIFFHISVFSESDYSGKNPKTIPSPLLAYGWQGLDPIIGMPLSSFRKIDYLSVNDVIDSGLGLEHCINMIQTQKKGFWVWENNKMVWREETFSDFDDYEMAIYSLKWCINNSLNYLSQILPIKSCEEQKIEIFIKHFLTKSLIADFLEASEFKNKINIYREEFINNPDKFRTRYNIINLNNQVISIINNVKNKLLSIQKLEDKEYFLPKIEPKVPILLSYDLKKIFDIALLKKNYDKIFLITDGNVSKWYDLKPWIQNHNIPFRELLIDETISDKSPEKLLLALKFAEKSGITTSSLVILFGGGSIGNLGGMVAGLCFRGLDFIHIPTTLLAQLDSSIGCKQSVNGFISKNKFGLFHAPQSININILFNDTLEEIQIRSGLIEALKHGLCQSKELLKDVVSYCEKYLNIQNGQSLNLESIERIIHKTIEYKLQYMNVDPYENSPEQHLELGHKVGHALEFMSSEMLPHGICVAFGMIAEAKFFLLQNKISSNILKSLTNNIKSVVKTIDNLSFFDNEKILQNISLDNKIKKNEIPLVLLKKMQKPESIYVMLNNNSMKLFEQSLNYTKEVFNAN
jgi:3-dehydroquinate synthase